MISKKGLIEGLVFASGHPVSKQSICHLLEIPEDEIAPLLEELKADYENETHGFSFNQVAGGYQFRTKTELKDIMARFYEKKPARLTQATLEVLAVIAYKQPITRPEIERIRGVDCTGILKTLLERELIEMRGRSDLPGHPVVYGTTPKFLEWFQVNSLTDLPPLSEMEALNRGAPAETEGLLQLLNRDDGFQAESLTEMDETIKAAGKVDIVDPETAFAAETEAERGEVHNAATTNPAVEAQV